MGTTTTKERAAASASAGHQEEEEEEEEEEYPAASSSAPAEGDGLSSAPAEREKKETKDLSIIVHPAFTHLCASPPEVFCPLDWLPDEVIFNVCIHLVGLLSTSPSERVTHTHTHTHTHVTLGCSMCVCFLFIISTVRRRWDGALVECPR